MSAPNKAQFGTGSDQAGERARVIHARCDFSGVHSKSVLNLWGQVEDFGAESLTLAAIASPQPSLQRTSQLYLWLKMVKLACAATCTFGCSAQVKVPKVPAEVPTRFAREGFQAKVPK